MHRLEFLFQNLKPGIILDIGNLEKRGALHKRIIETFPSATVHGLDIVDQASLGLSFPNQTIGSFEKLPYQDNLFDFIYMGEVLEHTWVPKQVIDECYRVLKPGGQLIMDTPNVYSLSRILRYLATGKDIILGNPEHKIFFSRAMLENLLLQSNFTIKQLTTEINFDTFHLKFRLPNFGTFKFMGECLLVVAQKNS